MDTMTSFEAARVIALVIPAALVAMWAVLYRGMRSAADLRCPARARREAAAQARPAGTLTTVGAQRTAREDADVLR